MEFLDLWRLQTSKKPTHNELLFPVPYDQLFIRWGMMIHKEKKKSSLQFVSAVMTKGFHVAFKPRMLEKKIKITQINDHIQKHHQDILELMENYFFKNICYAQLHTDSTSFLLIMKP